ncbi:hypothetical protein RUND412_010405, partial [Rhizina undulata]
MKAHPPFQCYYSNGGNRYSPGGSVRESPGGTKYGYFTPSPPPAVRQRTPGRYGFLNPDGALSFRPEDCYLQPGDEGYIRGQWNLHPDYQRPDSQPSEHAEVGFPEEGSPVATPESSGGVNVVLGRGPKGGVGMRALGTGAGEEEGEDGDEDDELG